MESFVQWSVAVSGQVLSGHGVEPEWMLCRPKDAAGDKTLWGHSFFLTRVE